MTADSQAPICESLLHRLIDDVPQKQSLTQAQGAISVDTLYDRIRSNLEKILNTRKVPIKNLSSYQHLPSSLLQYGTPDFCHSYYGSKPAQKKLCKEIKDAIAQYETRLSNVQVDIIHHEVEIERMLKIRISAHIMLKGQMVDAHFESQLDVMEHQFNFQNI